jgi:hypothetical protein
MGDGGKFIIGSYMVCTLYRLLFGSSGQGEWDGWGCIEHVWGIREMFTEADEGTWRIEIIWRSRRRWDDNIIIVLEER